MASHLEYYKGPPGTKRKFKGSYFVRIIHLDCLSSHIIVEVYLHALVASHLIAIVEVFVGYGSEAHLRGTFTRSSGVLLNWRYRHSLSFEGFECRNVKNVDMVGAFSAMEARGCCWPLLETPWAGYGCVLSYSLKKVDIVAWNTRTISKCLASPAHFGLGSTKLMF